MPNNYNELLSHLVFIRDHQDSDTRRDDWSTSINRAIKIVEGFLPETSDVPCLELVVGTDAIMEELDGRELLIGGDG